MANGKPRNMYNGNVVIILVEYWFMALACGEAFEALWIGGCAQKPMHGYIEQSQENKRDWAVVARDEGGRREA